MGRTAALAVGFIALIAFGLWGLSRPRGEVPADEVRRIRSSQDPQEPGLEGAASQGGASSVPLDERRRDPREVYDPDDAGEPMPPGYRRLLGRDAIRPIYEPEIVPGSQVRWPDDSLVIGVFLEGPDGAAARAYPVRALNAREMVIDRLAGMPILVTW